MITDRQLAALKYLIEASRHGTPDAKRLLWFLVDRSDRLTKEICVCLSGGAEGYSGEEIHKLALSLRGVTGRSGSTHLNQILPAMGSDMQFSLHFGGYESDKTFDMTGMFPGVPEDMVTDKKLAVLNAPIRYTFWMARKYYADSASLVRVTRTELEAIDLSRPGLYPDLERDQQAS